MNRVFSISLFLLIHGFVWLAMILLAKPNLDFYGDMVEVWAWAQHWLLGSDKHPQLLPWGAKLWYMAAPTTLWSFYALAMVNLAIGLFGVRAFARACGLDQNRQWLTMGLCVLAMPYLTLADTLNMNSINLATWPWAAWAFVRMGQTKGAAQIIYGAALGVFSAAAVQGKYFAAVLLLAFGLLALTRRWRHMILTPGTAVSLLAFAAAMAPHVWWLAQDEFSTLRYAGEQGGGETRWDFVAAFVFIPFWYWIVPLGLALGFLYEGDWKTRLRKAFHMEPGGDALWVFAVLPWAIVVVLGVLGVAELSPPWAILLGFSFTALLARNADEGRVARYAPQAPTLFLRRVWPLMLLGGVLYGQMNGMVPMTPVSHYRPEQEAALKIVDTWNAAHPGQSLRWAAKENWGARVAYFAPDGEHIEALPNLPDRMPHYYPMPEGWREAPGVIVCGFEPSDKTSPNVAVCLAEVHDFAATYGLKAEEAVFEIARGGWRHWRRVPYTITVVYTAPQTD